MGTSHLIKEKKTTVFPFIVIIITQHWSGFYSSSWRTSGNGLSIHFRTRPIPTFCTGMSALYKRISVTDSRIGWFALEQARKAKKNKKKNTHYIIHCPTQSHRLELFTAGWLQNKSVKWVRAFKSVSSEFYLPWPKIVHLSGVEPCDLHNMKGKKTNK